MGRVDQHTFDHLLVSPTGARAVRRNPDGYAEQTAQQTRRARDARPAPGEFSPIV
jgi:hypothetical protein